MGSLVQMPMSEVWGTLEKLAKEGIDSWDFDQIRQHPFFAKRVAQVFQEHRRLVEDAIGENEEAAFRAIDAIDHWEVLAKVVPAAKLKSAACRAVGKLPDHEAYHFARLNENREVVAAALRRCGDNQLWNLWCGAGLSGWRKVLVKAERDRRHI